MGKQALRLVVLALAVGVGGGLAGRLHADPEDGRKVHCPVTKQEIFDTLKAVRLSVNGETLFFCCDRCPERLKKEPDKHLKEAIKDPVNGKSFKVTAKTPRLEYKGGLYLFNSAESKAAFEANPAKYVKPSAS